VSFYPSLFSISQKQMAPTASGVARISSWGGGFCGADSGQNIEVRQ